MNAQLWTVIHYLMVALNAVGFGVVLFLFYQDVTWRLHPIYYAGALFFIGAVISSAGIYYNWWL